MSSFGTKLLSKNQSLLKKRLPEKSSNFPEGVFGLKKLNRSTSDIFCGDDKIGKYQEFNTPER